MGFGGWTDAAWRHLDVNRDALLRDLPIIFLLGPAAICGLGANAPNIRSYLGAFHSIVLDPSIMSSAELEDRLADLREFSGMSDADVVALAQAGTLPSDPRFVEWLVLVRRGDLI